MLLLGRKSAEERVVSFLLAIHRKSAVGNDIAPADGSARHGRLSGPDDRDSVENDDEPHPARSRSPPRPAACSDLAQAQRLARYCRQLTSGRPGWVEVPRRRAGRCWSRLRRGVARDPSGNRLPGCLMPSAIANLTELARAVGPGERHHP